MIEIDEYDRLELIAEDRAKKRYLAEYGRHPDCRDPKHPGCEDCMENDDEQATSASNS